MSIQSSVIAKQLKEIRALTETQEKEDPFKKEPLRPQLDPIYLSSSPEINQAYKIYSSTNRTRTNYNLLISKPQYYFPNHSDRIRNKINDYKSFLVNGTTQKNDFFNTSLNSSKASFQSYGKRSVVNLSKTPFRNKRTSLIYRSFLTDNF